MYVIILLLIFCFAMQFAFENCQAEVLHQCMKCIGAAIPSAVAPEKADEPSHHIKKAVRLLLKVHGINEKDEAVQVF